MREVAVIGVGMHPFGRFPDKPVQGIARVAVTEALKDANVDWRDIQAAYCGHVYQGMVVGQTSGTCANSRFVHGAQAASFCSQFG